MSPLLILAASATVWFNPNPPEEQIMRYDIYVGIQSIVAGNAPIAIYPLLMTGEPQIAVDGLSLRVDGLDYGITYFFTAKAVNASGESGYSNEVQYTVPLPTPEPTPTPTPTPTPEPTPQPTPIPTPTPTPTPDHPGHAWGWWK